MKIISRKEALAGGLIRYFTGEPCKHGHISERFTLSRLCAQCNIEKLRAYYSSDRDATRRRWKEQGATKRKRNPEKIREGVRKNMRAFRSRKDQEENRKVWREQYASAKKNNPSRLRASAHAKRYRHRCGGEDVTTAEIEHLLVQQRHRCAYSFCGKSLSEGYHIDHIIPLARGGKNSRRNRQLLCPSCNLSKGAKEPTDFARSRGLLL